EYPYAYKTKISREISYKSSISSGLGEELNQNHTDTHYDPIKKEIGAIILNIKKIICGICESKIVQMALPERVKSTLDHQIHKIGREYYSEVKKILGSRNFEEKDLYNETVAYGYNIIDKYLGVSSSLTFDEVSVRKKILKLPYAEQDAVLEACISKNMLFFPFVLNTFFGNDVQKKYEYIEQAVQQSPNNTMYDDAIGLESVFDQFHLYDIEKNYSLLRALIEKKEGNIQCEHILKFGCLHDQEKREICELLFHYKKYDALLSSFECLGIQEEECRIYIAKIVAEHGHYIGKYIDTFNIQDKKILRELIDINREPISKKEIKESRDPNLINSIKKFQIPEEDIFETIGATLNRETKFDIKKSGITDPEVIYQCIQKIISFHSDSDSEIFQKNFTGYILFLRSCSSSIQDKYYKNIGKDLSTQTSYQKLLVFVKDLINAGVLEHREYESIFCSLYSQSLTSGKTIPDVLDTLIYVRYKDIPVSPFSTKKDMMILLEALDSSGYISTFMKEIIGAENKNFEQIYDALLVLFKNETPINQGGNDIKYSKYEEKIDENKGPVENSRNIFFTELGIPFPDTSKKYKERIIKELYGNTLKLYKIVGRDFFEKLELDPEIFQKNNIENLSQFFYLVYDIVYPYIDPENSLKKTKGIKNIQNHSFSDSFENTKLKDLGMKITNILSGKIDIFNIKQVNGLLSELIFQGFQEKFSMENNDFGMEKLLSFEKKWGDIEIFSILYSAYSKFPKQQAILARVVNMCINDRFLEYKYEGYSDDYFDEKGAADQLRGTTRQKNEWKKNNSYLHIPEKKENISQGRNIFEQMKEKIHNGLIDNKHLDEIGSGYTESIMSYIPTQEEEEYINKIKSERQQNKVISEGKNFHSKKMYDIGFYALLSSKKKDEIIRSIKFIKKISKNSKEKCGGIIKELNTILGLEKLLQGNNSESVFYTIETDNPKLLLEIGSLVPGVYSCLHYKSKDRFLPFLPAYVIDAGVKTLLTFEIKKTDMKDISTWNSFLEIVAGGDYTENFNPYMKQLHINDMVFDFPFAVSRKIMKLGYQKRKPCVYGEKIYTRLNIGNQNYMYGFYEDVIKEKNKALGGGKLSEDIDMPESRNDDIGIYNDTAGKGELGPYIIKPQKRTLI
ncbi:MAG: hypothetical protein GY828_06830, partial [Candidatus Gracilibacteria bacterium]|nr:hypothetical protein [Candidatus Gracilibacteria bacterium]